MNTRPHAFGVYVHVPFCARRCDYCAFATWTDRHHLTDAYVRACRRRWRWRSGRAAAGVVGVLRRRHPVPAVARSARLDPRCHPRRPGAEVTVECNPETVDISRLGAIARRE